jgi:predicted NAD/FAD-dependent oxidoreductase
MYPSGTGRSEYDVIIIGGAPCGLACARELKWLDSNDRVRLESSAPVSGNVAFSQFHAVKLGIDIARQLVMGSAEELPVIAPTELVPR